MLKKIVKYGNSRALVLDKALLELLNMEEEGAIVKITTDGISLIVTPQKALAQETVSPTLTIEGMLHDAKRQALEQSFGDPEKASTYLAALQEILDRYAMIVKNKLNTPEIGRTIAAIQKRFAKDEANPECVKEIKKAYQQYVPELASMSKEMEALIKKYAPMSDQDWNIANIGPWRDAFAQVHEKYRHVLSAVAALDEDPEHIHEMMLIGEKYQVNQGKGYKEHKECLEACAQLIAKRVPEYAVYREELQKVGEKYNQREEKVKNPALTTGRKKKR